VQVSLRPRRVPAFLTLLTFLATLAVVGASVTLVLLEESRDLRVTLCATIAVAVAVITLLSPPAVTPQPALAGRRRRGAAALGRLLVRLCWLLRVGINGAAAWVITWNADSAAIQPLAAGLVALSMLLVVVVQAGQHLAGFVTAVDDLRGRGLLNRAGAIVVAAVTAGSAGYLAALTERFRDLVVSPVWGLTREAWGLPTFFAVILTALWTIVVVLLIAGVVGVAMLSVAQLLGPGSAVGRWLAEHSPVKLTRWVDGVRVSITSFTDSGPPTKRAARWLAEELRHSSGPLPPDFILMLADDVERARTELVRDTGRDASVALRAVGDHEEIVLEHTEDGEPERHEAELLRDFPEAEALRRIRLALHDPVAGLPSVVRCSPGDGLEAPTDEPDWLATPGHEDLLREVVRHPPGPAWVRERLGLPAVEPDW
jgi:hypothetical protein